MIRAPVPQRENEIALDAFRPRWRGRDFAVPNAVGPLRQCPGRPRYAHVGRRTVHRIAAYAGAEPPLPGRLRRFQIRLCLEDVIETAGETIAQLMTEIAVRLQPVDPVVLRQHRLAE